ncbi:hypothetical protein B1218_36510 [Pseudomonas ogarae]|nr:hypothetical protein B1218_36510 [Pseudomonas ogarae]
MAEEAQAGDGSGVRELRRRLEARGDQGAMSWRFGVARQYEGSKPGVEAVWRGKTRSNEMGERGA